MSDNYHVFITFAKSMSEKKRITFIVNPISGGHQKEEIIEMINQEMDLDRFKVDIRITEFAGHAVEIAHQCAAPCGSGNGLARHLCIPMNTRKALGILNECVIMPFDYGVVNDIPFFCTCGMGFDAFISLKFAEAGKRGPITYVENVLKEGLNYQPETYEVEDETGAHRYKAFLIACANASQYGNNAYIAPEASMRDGVLDVIIMEPFDALEAPQISIDLFNKTLSNNSKIKHFQTRKIHIHRQQPGAIHYDGDPIMTDPDVDIHIEHLGLRIVTNPEATEDQSQPNPVLNAFSDFFNNINNVREDIEKGGRKIQAINKLMLRKLSKL